MASLRSYHETLFSSECLVICCSVCIRHFAGCCCHNFTSISTVNTIYNASSFMFTGNLKVSSSRISLYLYMYYVKMNSLCFYMCHRKMNEWIKHFNDIHFNLFIEGLSIVGTLFDYNSLSSPTQVKFKHWVSGESSVKPSIGLWGEWYKVAFNDEI